MEKRTVLIFGESTAGKIQNLLLINTLPNLAVHLGEPTPTGVGIHLAVQALLFKKDVLFYKVSEEGMNSDQYLFGFKLLEKEPLKLPLAAIALPGVGSGEILEMATHLCNLHKSVLILNENDLYDLMTQSSS